MEFNVVRKVKSFMNRFLLALILLQLISSQTANDYQIFRQFRPYLPVSEVQAAGEVNSMSSTTNSASTISQQQGATTKGTQSQTNTTDINKVLEQNNMSSLSGYYSDSAQAYEKEQTLKNDEKSISQQLKNDPSLQTVFSATSGTSSTNSTATSKGNTSSAIAQGSNNKEPPKLTLDDGHEYCKSGAGPTCSSCDGVKGESKANCIQGLQETYFDIEKQISKAGVSGEGIVYLIFAAAAIDEAKIDLICPVANDAPTAKLLEKMGKTWFSSEIAINKQLRNEMTKLKTYLRKLTKKETEDDAKLNETDEQKKEREEAAEVNKIIAENSVAKPKAAPAVGVDGTTDATSGKVERDSLENIKKYYALMIIAYKKVVKAIEQKQTVLRTLFSFYYVVFVLGIVELVIQLILLVVLAVVGVAAALIFMVCIGIGVVLIIVGVVLLCGTITSVAGWVCVVIGVILVIVAIIALVVAGVAAYLIWRIYLYYSPVFPGCLSGGLDSQVALGMLAIEYCGNVNIPLSDFIGMIANVTDFIPLLNTLLDMIKGILDKVLELLIPGWVMPLSEIPKHVKAWREIFDSMLMEQKPRCVFCATQATVLFPIVALMLTSHVTRSILAVIQSVFAIVLSEVYLERKREEALKRIGVLRKILGYLSKLEEIEKVTPAASGGSYDFKIEDSETNSDKIESYVKAVEQDYENEMGSSALAGSERVCLCNGGIDKGCTIPPEKCSENTREPNIKGIEQVEAKVPNGYKTNINAHLLQADQEYKSLTSGNPPSDQVLLERAGKRISAAYTLKKQAQEHLDALKNSKFAKESYQIQYHSKRFEKELDNLKSAFPNMVSKLAGNKHIQDAFGSMGFMKNSEITDEKIEKKMKDNIYDRLGQETQNSLKDLFDSLNAESSTNFNQGNTGATDFGTDLTGGSEKANDKEPDFSKIIGNKNFGIVPKDDISIWRKITNRYHRKFIEWVKEGAFQND